MLATMQVESFVDLKTYGPYAFGVVAVMALGTCFTVIWKKVFSPYLADRLKLEEERAKSLTAQAMIAAALERSMVECRLTTAAQREIAKTQADMLSTLRVMKERLEVMLDKYRESHD